MPFRRKKKPLISMLVPLSGLDGSRLQAWHWLRRYWKDQIPGCEIVIGRDKRSQPSPWWNPLHRKQEPFSKTVAFNNAFKKSRGDIIVLLDADAYLPAKVITHCADRIRSARKAGVRLWFIPYSYLFRLTPQATEILIRSDPHLPYAFTQPPPDVDIESTHGSDHGHKFGAMAQIMGREAFDHLGGTDPKFRGWGGEDIAFMMALDTLWVMHTKTPNDILHLWHMKNVPTQSERPEATEIRTWAHQLAPRANNYLSEQYYLANGRPERMRWLVDSGHQYNRRP
jgi:predicted glycosyltransferase involved in capsule biosynthesis